MADLVERHERFRDLATNGLLLTLMCLAANDRRRTFDATTRRIHLYGWTVRDMLRGAHRAAADDDAVEVEERLLVLARATWAVFAEQPGDSPFSYLAWKRALQAACEDEHINEAHVDAFRTALIEQLKVVGLLVSPSSGELMFLHRSFFEYLAAAGLALRPLPAIV